MADIINFQEKKKARDKISIVIVNNSSISLNKGKSTIDIFLNIKAKRNIKNFWKKKSVRKITEAELEEMICSYIKRVLNTDTPKDIFKIIKDEILRNTNFQIYTKFGNIEDVKSPITITGSYIYVVS